MRRYLLLLFAICTALCLSGSGPAAHVDDGNTIGEIGGLPSLGAMVRHFSEPPPLTGMRRNKANVVVEAIGGGVYPADLPPGTYHTVRIEPGAEVVLSSGAYSIDSLLVGQDGIVWLDAYDLTGDGVVDPVIVTARKLDVDRGAEFAIIDPFNASTRHVEITVLQHGRITIPSDAVVRGTLLAPNAKVTFQEGSRLEGAVFAESVRLDPGVEIEFHDRAEAD
jgi:hypothetical protein